MKGVFWTATHHWLGLVVAEGHWAEQGVIAEYLQVGKELDGKRLRANSVRCED